MNYANKNGAYPLSAAFRRYGEYVKDATEEASQMLTDQVARWNDSLAQLEKNEYGFGNWVGDIVWMWGRWTESAWRFATMYGPQASSSALPTLVLVIDERSACTPTATVALPRGVSMRGVDIKVEFSPTGEKSGPTIEPLKHVEAKIDGEVLSVHLHSLPKGLAPGSLQGVVFAVGPGKPACPIALLSVFKHSSS